MVNTRNNQKDFTQNSQWIQCSLNFDIFDFNSRVREGRWHIVWGFSGCTGHHHLAKWAGFQPQNSWSVWFGVWNVGVSDGFSINKAWEMTWFNQKFTSQSGRTKSHSGGSFSVTYSKSPWSLSTRIFMDILWQSSTRYAPADSISPSSRPAICSPRHSTTISTAKLNTCLGSSSQALRVEDPQNFPFLQTLFVYRMVPQSYINGLQPQLNIVICMYVYINR